MRKAVTKRDVFQMRGASEVLAEIEDWCAMQRPIPSLTEAVKILIRKGLEAEAKKRRK
jgi:hypothetical protein